MLRYLTIFVNLIKQYIILIILFKNYIFNWHYYHFYTHQRFNKWNHQQLDNENWNSLLHSYSSVFFYIKIKSLYNNLQGNHAFVLSHGSRASKIFTLFGNESLQHITMMPYTSLFQSLQRAVQSIDCIDSLLQRWFKPEIFYSIFHRLYSMYPYTNVQREPCVEKKVVKVQTNVRIGISSFRQFTEINQINRSAGALLVKK